MTQPPFPAINVEYIASLSLKELVAVARCITDECWFWYLTGAISFKLPLNSPSTQALFEAAHESPADYEKALKVLRELEL